MFLEISSIKKHFGEGESRVEVLKGIDISIEKGEICVLLGPSGSGKSTLLNIIGGIDNADSGYISINGEKTADMNEKTLTLYRRKHLGYIFQMYNLIPNLNIKENVEVGAYLSDHPLDVDDLLRKRWGFMNTGTSCRISFLVGSSSEPPSAEPLSKIRIFCFAMSRPVHWTTTPPKKSYL